MRITGSSEETDKLIEESGQRGLRLEITLGTAATPCDMDVAAVLRFVAENQDKGMDQAFVRYPILDPNGNTVGTYRFCLEEEARS